MIKNKSISKKMMKEIYLLYTLHPFLDIEKLTDIAKDKFEMNLSVLDLIKLMNEFYPEAIKERNLNKKIYKGLIPDEELEQYYQMYLKPDEHSIEDIVELINEKYNLDIKETNLVKYWKTNHPETNRVKYKNKVISRKLKDLDFSPDKLIEILQPENEYILEKYINYPFESTQEIAKRLKDNKGISVTNKELSLFIDINNPDAKDIRKNNKKVYNENLQSVLQEDFIRKLYSLYALYPYLSLSEIQSYIQDVKNVRVAKNSLIKIIETLYPNAKNERKENKKCLKGLIVEEDINYIYSLYTSYPFVSIDKLIIYLNNKYNINISREKIINILKEKDSSFKETRRLNKEHINPVI